MRPLLSLALLALVAPAPDELRPGAEEGDVVRRTFALESTRLFVGMELSMNGEPLPAPDGPGAGLAIERRRTVTVTDEVTAAAFGFPTAIERTFDELTLTQTARTGAGAAAETLELTARSSLEGRCAALASAGGGWGASWCDGSAEDAALLLGLTGALDLSELLPTRAVEPGDEWRVSPLAWRVLQAPGGALGFAWEDPPDDATLEETARMEAALLDGLGGTLTATWRAREGDVAVVDLEGELTARATIELGDGGADQPFHAGSTRAHAWTYDLAGELRWDVAAGRLVSLTLGGDLGLVQTTSTRLSTDSGMQVLEEVLTFEGEVRHDVATAAD